MAAPYPDKVKVARAVELRSRGLSIRAVALAMGCPAKSVQRWLKYAERENAGVGK